jgi:hypothetical protein
VWCIEGEEESIESFRVFCGRKGLRADEDADIHSSGGTPKNPKEEESHRFTLIFPEETNGNRITQLYEEWKTL